MPDLDFVPARTIPGRGRSGPLASVRSSAKVAGKSVKAAGKSTKAAGKSTKIGGKSTKSSVKAARRSARGAGKSAQAVGTSAATGARAAWSTLQIVMGVFAPERRRRTRRKPSAPTVTAAAAAGAGIEYLLDPANGKQRRRALRRRVQSRSVTT